METQKTFEQITAETNEHLRNTKRYLDELEQLRKEREEWIARRNEKRRRR